MATTAGKPARSRGRPSISVERIVATALQIVDEEGADGLSMRTLAQRMDSGTATLYRHFTSRDELVAQVVDLVYGSVELDIEGLRAMSWQQAIKIATQATFEGLRKHAGVAPLFFDRLPVGPNAMAQRERVIALLLDNGFTPKLAARSYATLAHYVLGFVAQLDGHATTTRPTDKKPPELPELDHDLFPATATVARHLPVPLEDEFAFGLDLIIGGLAQLVGK